MDGKVATLQKQERSFIRTYSSLTYLQKSYLILKIMSTLMSTYIHICYASRFIMDRIPKFRATVFIYVKRKWIRFLKEV